MADYDSNRLWMFALAVGALNLVPQLARGEGAAASNSKLISRIPPGTIVDDPQAARWNRVILLARPRMASGETSALSESVLTTASKFTLTILASVLPEPASEADSVGQSPQKPVQYKLAEVGVGYSLDIGGRLTIISTDSAARLGVKLGYLESQVLAENERQLTALRLVAKTTTLAIFDAPAIILREGSHQDFSIRHMIWIDPASGRVSTLVWLLGTTNDTGYEVVDEPLKLLAPGTREDRAIHVDGDQFFLGIPSQRAFALQGLPPGKAVQWSNELRALAAGKNYSAKQLVQLTVALNDALTSLAKE